MKTVGDGELSRELVRKGSNLGLEALKCTHDAKSSVNDAWCKLPGDYRDWHKAGIQRV